jgi:outer membrane protein assembly factor BamB
MLPENSTLESRLGGGPMIVWRRMGGWSALFGLILLAAVVGQPENLRAQNKVIGKLIAPAITATKDADKPFTDAVTLPVDREARRLMQAAQDYIKKKEWRIASECLQSLLENREDSFLEVESATDEGKTEKRRVSVRTEANRLIGELPPDGLEFYQVQYGQAAEVRLKEALEKNDAAILAEVALRYLHTQAGAEATSLLATYHLDRGSYLMAALCFERLLSRPDADKLTGKTLFKAALAFRRAGDTGSEDKTWKRLAEKTSRGDLLLGKQKVTLEQLRGELERPSGLLTSLAPRETYVFRGNAARSSIGSGGAAFLEPRWTASMYPLDEAKEDLDGTAWIKLNLEIAFKSLENKPVLPSFFPVATGGNLLYRTYDGVYCVALRDSDTADGKKKAGELLWRSSTNWGLHGMARLTDRKATLDQWYSGFYRQPTFGPVGVLFENAIVGTLSHDTQRVYFVDDLAVPPHQSMLANVNVVGGGVSFRPFDKQMRTSQLTAVDIETGKLAWRVPPTDDDRAAPAGTATELSETFFLGPPLPLGGKLYALVEKNTEFRLICLDPAKLDGSGYPEILWIQSLGTANVRLMQDSLRRVQAAHLAYGDGILVCPTNAGAVIGIDLLSHSLVWAYSYRDGSPQSLNDDMQGMGMIRGRGIRGIQPAGPPAHERWRTSAPVIQGGKVVFTAHDAGQLHCLNLRDGRLLWTVKREDDDLYLAGVYGSRVVIVGRNYIRAVNFDEGPRDTWGKAAWKLSTGGLPSGQGVASDDVYYLPLQKTGDGSQAGPGILAVNLTTGKKISVAAKRNQELPGNLIFADGDIISQTATSIAAYPQLRVKEMEISRRLKDNPDDPIGLTERGELFLYDGKLNEAVVDLRSALAHQPPVDARLKARNKLHEALTELFQDKFSEAEKYLDEYRDLCKVEVPADADASTRQKLADEQLRREANYLSLVGRGREAQGRLLDALVAYEQFGALTGNKELISVVDELNTRSRPDVWSRGRIKGMIDKSSAEQRRQIEAAINERYRTVKDGGPADLRKFVAVYGTSFPVGREAQLRLADALVAEGSSESLTEAESKLQSLCFAPDVRKQDPSVAARAIEGMIRIYVRRGLYEDAVSLYKQLGEEFKSIVVIDGKTGADLLQELMIDKRFLPYLEPHGLTWKGVFKASDVSTSYNATVTSLTIDPEGDLLPFFRRHRLVLDVNMQGGNAWSFRVLDRATNAERWKVSGLPVANYFLHGQNVPPPNFRFAYARGHVLVLHLNNIVSAYNLAEQKPLWSYNLFGKNPLYANNPQAQIMMNPDGRLGIAHPDGRQERLGGVAAVESSYVCLQTRDGLVALDLTRPGPSVLWTKAGVSLKAEVFGDDEHVYIVEGGTDGVPFTTRALRAQDGVTVVVPEFGTLYTKRIRTLGRHLLLQEDESGGGKLCRLYDVQNGRDVWRQSFGSGAIVMRSEEPNLMGVVEKDHTVTLLDSRTGHIVFRSLILAEHAEKLQSVALVGDRERFYLALGREKENGLNWQPSVIHGLRSLPVNGPVYALNRTTGKLEWICDFLPHQNLLLEQVEDLPMILFTTAYSKLGPNGNFERNATKVTAIDKRTGKLLYDKEFMQQGLFQTVRTDPQNGSIDLLRGDLKISFRLDGAVATADIGPTQGPGRAVPVAPVRAVPVPISQ